MTPEVHSEMDLLAGCPLASRELSPGAFKAFAGQLVTGDAAGGGDSGGGDCGADGIHGEDGVPDGAGGTSAKDLAGAAGTDGASGGMRSGVRAGSVGAVAGGSCDGVGGAGDVEEEVYEQASRQGGELAGRRS